MLNALLIATFALSVPLVLAAMGGFTSERSGVINIGLEGMMLMSCCVCALTSVHFGPGIGLLCGIGASICLSLLHWLVTQHYRIDHVISGMAINAIAAGSTNFLADKFTDPTRVGQVPHFPTLLYLILAVVAPFGLFLYAKFTRGGLRMLAVGSDPDKARLMGVQPVKVRFFGLIATGVLTGLAGAQLVSDSGVFTTNMTAGRGYIALAALILGGWRPIPALLACVAFGFFNALQIQFKGAPVLGVNLPSEVWASLPYLVTIIALAGFLGRNRTPAGLGKP